jgi:hypothetical protein
MRSTVAMSFGKRDVPHSKSRVNPDTRLATAMARAFGHLTLALRFRFALWQKPLKDRGLFDEVGRHLGVSPHDLDQHLVILGATAIGLNPMYQRQRCFGAQIHLLEVSEEFEASKHDGLHLKGDQAQGVGIRCLM